MTGREAVLDQLVAERYSRRTAAWFGRRPAWLDDSEEATERRRLAMADDFDRIDRSTRAESRRRRKRA